MLERQQEQLINAAKTMHDVLFSHVNGRDLLDELQPNQWHYCNIQVRINGQDKIYEGDWLKRLWHARQEFRRALSEVTNEYQFDQQRPEPEVTKTAIQESTR